MSFFFVFVLFASCATAPKVSFPKEDESRELSLLPAGGKFYLWADVTQSRSLLEQLSFEGMSGSDAARMLDSTSTAAAVVFDSDSQAQGGQGRRFFLAASGDFPRRRANFSLSFSRGWKKIKGSGGNRYWYSQNDRLALALGSELVLVSDSDPWGILTGELTAEIPPEAFMEFRRGNALAGWLPNPSGSINSFMETLGIPILIPAEELYFGAVRLPGAIQNWELIFKIRTPSESNARSLLTLFSMARLFVQRGALQQSGLEGLFREDMISPQEAAALLFARVPEQAGEFLNLKMGPLNESKIALLFNLFSVYSE